MAIYRSAFTLAALAAAVVAAPAPQPALAQSVAPRSAPLASAPPVRVAQTGAAVLTCTIHPPPFGSGEVTVTNVGTAQVPAGGVILVIPVQAGGASAVYALPAALPPGGSASFPMTGVSLLARGCAASIR